MEAQYLLNILFTIACGFVGYIFTRTQNYGERIQRLEDTTNNEVKDLKQDFKEFKKDINLRFEKIDNKLAELSSYVHGKKNAEMQMEKTLHLLLKHLEKHDEKDNL
jgi:hypothetical protein